MIERDSILKQIAQFKTRHGVQDQDEHIITTIHLMNTHRLDLASAQDQTSHGAHDHGIDGWHYDEPTATLHLYQSKLTSGKNQALKGFEELLSAAQWLATLISTDEVKGSLSNAAIYNLARCVNRVRANLKNVLLYVISPFNHNELLDCAEYEDARRDLVKSDLNRLLTASGGRIDLQPQAYNLQKTLESAYSTYDVTGISGKELSTGKKTQLSVFYLHLASLVELFRRRGNRLFEKNVRLYFNTKESRSRLEHPLEDTLSRICSGQLEPNIFPFFHVGITVIAGECRQDENGKVLLETPNVINGCQTINIADRFLRKLEKERDAAKINRFNQIPLLAKVVVAASEDQVREIANCNNRQNPIEPWQLFSNDPVHVQIEQAFLEKGIFYERQRGRFDAEMKSDTKKAETLNRYHSTNGTRITVEELGQHISLCRRQLQIAAKPSEIFASKEAHDHVFTWSIAERHVHDAVWAFNAFKAVKTGLRNYLRAPAHDNEVTHSIFVKPIVKMMLYYTGVMHLYQRCNEWTLQYGYRLNKIAPQKLVAEAEGFFRKVVSKTKNWYLDESNKFEVEVSQKKIEQFIDRLCVDSGLDTEGPMPFFDTCFDWSDEEEPAEIMPE